MAEDAAALASAWFNWLLMVSPRLLLFYPRTRAAGSLLIENRFLRRVTLDHHLQRQRAFGFFSSRFKKSISHYSFIFLFTYTLYRVTLYIIRGFLGF